jgi:hypothetical protein
MGKITQSAIGGSLGAMLVVGASVGATAQQELGGYTWEQLGAVTDRGWTEVTSIATLPDGTIGMLGHQCADVPCFEQDPTMLGWSSTDGGQTWTEAEVDLPAGPARRELTAFGDQFLTLDEDRVLASPDALSWEVLSEVPDAELMQMSVTPEGLAVIGSRLRPTEGWGEDLAPHTTLWRSSDGIEWQAHEIAPPRFGPEVEGFSGVDGIARSGDGSWLVMGFEMLFEGDFQPVTWAVHGSPETGWTEAGIPDGASFGVAWGLPEGFLVSLEFPKSHDWKTGLWRTTDGSDWTEIVDTEGHKAVYGAAPLGDRGFLGFKDAAVLPNGYETLTEDVAWLDGAPVYLTLDGRTWVTGDLLEGIDVESISVAADGTVLAAGTPAPCSPSCEWGLSDASETPMVMRGTPS